MWKQHQEKPSCWKSSNNFYVFKCPEKQTRTNRIINSCLLVIRVMNRFRNTTVKHKWCHLKLALCVFGIRNAYDLILSTFRKTLPTKHNNSQLLNSAVFCTKTQKHILPTLCKRIRLTIVILTRIKKHDTFCITYVEMPERQSSDDHGRGRPSFTVPTVEHKRRERIFCQTRLHGLQQSIKTLNTCKHMVTQHCRSQKLHVEDKRRRLIRTELHSNSPITHDLFFS